MKIKVIPLVIGALGTTPPLLPKTMKDIGIAVNFHSYSATIF